MPTNIRRGNSALFTVEFLDEDGVLSIPATATVTITYYQAANPLSQTVTTIDMEPTGSFFTATWDTSVSALNLADYAINAPNQVIAPSFSGQLRIIQ